MCVCMCVCVCVCKDSALNKLQRFICNEIQLTNQYILQILKRHYVGRHVGISVGMRN